MALPSQSQSKYNNNSDNNNKCTWFKSFQYDKENEKASETRNVLLIVAALVTAVTFQAGVNPPGGVWQDDEGDHEAGNAIYANQAISFYIFLICNSFALSSSILVIISLTYKFPFHFEIWVATISMLITYGSAVSAVTPDETQFRYVLTSVAMPFLLRSSGGSSLVAATARVPRASLSAITPKKNNNNSDKYLLVSTFVSNQL